MTKKFYKSSACSCIKCVLGEGRQNREKHKQKLNKILSIRFCHLVLVTWHLSLLLLLVCCGTAHSCPTRKILLFWTQFDYKKNMIRNSEFIFCENRSNGPKELVCSKNSPGSQRVFAL